jgi:bacterioferritin
VEITMSGHNPEPHRNSGPSNNAVHARAIAQDEETSTAKGSLEKELPPAKSKAPQRLVLDLKAIEEAKRSLDQGAVTPHYGPWRNDIIALLNDSLATELICSLRYRRHHFTAEGLFSPKIAEEFLVHANEEMAHADMLAKRIVELGGMPDFSPDSLTRRSHAGYDESRDLKSMMTANLIAERVAIESYSQMIALIGDKDSTTRRLIEEILAVEQAHAEDLRDWLAN